MDLAKIDDLSDDKESLKLQIMFWENHIKRSVLKRFNEIVQTLEKMSKWYPGMLLLGWILPFCMSPRQFRAMLNLDQGFVEPLQISINLEEGCEKSSNFLHEGEVENLAIRKEAHFQIFFSWLLSV